MASARVKNRRRKTFARRGTCACTVERFPATVTGGLPAGDAALHAPSKSTLIDLKADQKTVLIRVPVGRLQAAHRAWKQCIHDCFYSDGHSALIDAPRHVLRNIVELLSRSAAGSCRGTRSSSLYLVRPNKDADYPLTTPVRSFPGASSPSASSYSSAAVNALRSSVRY